MWERGWRCAGGLLRSEMPCQQHVWSTSPGAGPPPNHPSEPLTYIMRSTCSPLCKGWNFLSSSQISHYISVESGMNAENSNLHPMLHLKRDWQLGSTPSWFFSMCGPSFWWINRYIHASNTSLIHLHFSGLEIGRFSHLRCTNGIHIKVFCEWGMGAVWVVWRDQNLRKKAGWMYAEVHDPWKALNTHVYHLKSLQSIS